MTLTATDDEIIYESEHELEPDVDSSHFAIRTLRPRLERRQAPNPLEFYFQCCTPPIYSLADARTAYEQPRPSTTLFDQWA
jgi:hypothetical protein